MPLTGHFDWEEKKDHFVVKVPLKGVAPSKVDVFGNNSVCVAFMLKILFMNLL